VLVGAVDVHDENVVALHRLTRGLEDEFLAVGGEVKVTINQKIQLISFLLESSEKIKTVLLIPFRREKVRSFLATSFELPSSLMKSELVKYFQIIFSVFIC